MKHEPVETTLYSLRESPPEPAQRRTNKRHLSLFRVGALMVDGRRELCLIRNISAGGMMIRAYSRLPVGTRISIELKQGQLVSGTAKWVERESVGVEFDTPVDVVSLITAPEDGPRPRMPRIEVQCLASLRHDGQTQRVTVLNISQGGLCARCADDLQPGSDVVVSLPGIPPVAGVVKWRDEDLTGIGFNRLLSLSELVAWLQDQDRNSRTSTGR